MKYYLLSRLCSCAKVIGTAKDWDEKAQIFIPKSLDATEKNKTLAELKGRYETVAKQWEKEGKAWSPRQLSHCFETEGKRKEEVKVLPVSQCIDAIVEQLKNRKRFKNGKVLSSVNTARSYYYFKNTLDQFTQDKYDRKFSTYFFNEINEQFVNDFVRKILRNKLSAYITGINFSTTQFLPHIPVIHWAFPDKTVNPLIWDD